MMVVTSVCDCRYFVIQLWDWIQNGTRVFSVNKAFIHSWDYFLLLSFTARAKTKKKTCWHIVYSVNRCQLSHTVLNKTDMTKCLDSNLCDDTAWT